jgi:fructose-1,6-bisphosphatase/inositol monophosphatase family enzyme
MATQRFVLPTSTTSHLAIAQDWPNCHGAGVALKEYLRRAVLLIDAGLLTFSASAKAGDPNRPDDVVTDIDHKVEEKLLIWFLETFPGAGIIAEEPSSLEALRARFPNRSFENVAEKYLHLLCVVEGLGGVRLYLVLDPIDGTKAFTRRERRGVASQVALVAYIGDKYYVLAAFVIDAHTREIFGYRPGSDNVHRITRLETSERLNDVVGLRPLQEGLAVLRDAVDLHGSIVQRMMAPRAKGGLLKTHSIETGSMSLSYATLWTTGVMLVTAPFGETPWDLAPNLGISLKLGFVPFIIVDDTVLPYQYPLTPEPYRREGEVVWLHQNQLAEFYAWCHANKIRFQTLNSVQPLIQP